MKTAQRFVGIVAIVTVGLPLSAAALSLQEIVQRNRNSVVCVKVETANPTTGARTEVRGTGFIVSKEGWLLTSQHVVSTSVGIDRLVRGSVGSCEGTFENMEVLVENTNTDFALLRFKNTAPQRMAVTFGNPWSVGDAATVYSMGFPGNEEWFHTAGTLSGKNGPMGSWNTTLVLNPGMSGAPVFDSDGRVVALVWGGVPTPGVTGINRMLPIDLIILALRAAGTLACVAGASIPTFGCPGEAAAATIDVSYTVDDTQESRAGFSPTSAAYTKTFQARPGYKITDFKYVSRSANYATVNSVEVAEDQRSVTIKYSLKSGPVFDRWRGWIDGTIVTRQERE